MALLAAVAAFGAPLLFHGSRESTLVLLVLCGIVLDMGASGNLVLGQRAIFALGAEMRSRLNGLYISIFFAGGAFGSWLGGWTWAHYGWHGVLVAGLLFPLVALLVFATERRD